MINAGTVKNILSSIIPISRFNKGEANKIFDEVNNTGYKIVVKNNNPTCILVNPKSFQQMLDEIEDYHLLLEATQRMSEDNIQTFTSQQVMNKFGITQSDLDEIEVEIE